MGEPLNAVPDIVSTEMVKIKYSTVYPEELHIGELGNTGGNLRKVGTLRRKSGGKTYESPKIVLDSYFKAFVGRRFKVFRGRALHTRDLPNYRGDSKPIRIESTGDCLILFFPDEKA